MVLVLSLVLLVLGLAFLGSRARQYQSVLQAYLGGQAEEMARSGIEDARVKLDQDIGFPPPLAVEQNTFSYAESIYDPSGAYLGSYQVVIDTSYKNAPFYLMCINSTGTVGAPGAPPTASHTYLAYLDINPAHTATYYSFVRWDDLGCP